MNERDYLRAASLLSTSEGLDSWTALMRVLVAHLRKMDLPESLLPALTSAESHWSGNPVDLIETKVWVWRYIRTKAPEGDDLSTPAGRAARALLCVLEPLGDDEDESMTADWFASMTADQHWEG